MKTPTYTLTWFRDMSGLLRVWFQVPLRVIRVGGLVLNKHGENFRTLGYLGQWLGSNLKNDLLLQEQRHLMSPCSVLGTWTGSIITHYYIPADMPTLVFKYGIGIRMFIYTYG